MNRFYIILLGVGLVSLALISWSPWWSLAAAAACMVFLAYRIYASRLYAFQIENTALGQQIEELHLQLDNSIRKEQRMSKAAEQATEVKKKLMTAMSRDIRTPMNGVMGMAGLLAETDLNEEQQEYIKVIRHSGEQLMAAVNHILVDDILNISKSGEESNQLENEDFHLRSCIEEVLEMFAGAVGDQGPDLLYHIDAGIPEQIAGDSNKLRQVLINLVENAVKFTSQGEVFIGVHLLKKEENGKMELAFEVRDTGRGIPADKIERIFEGVTAITPAEDDAKEGQGLGLVICRRLVEIMDGWIEVKSDPGKGCVFTFCISVSAGRKPLRNTLHLHMASLRDKRILVADDNALALTLLAGQLQEWRSLPVTAGSGRQALDLLSADPGFDLVIADADMPEISGIQLARSIREQHPHIPLILLTRAGSQQYQKEDQLFSAILHKPLRQHLLRDQLLHLFTTSNENHYNAPRNNMKQLQVDFAQQYPLRILIAEDNLINQKLIMKMLNKLGYDPQIVNNGKEVLDIVGHNRFDLIFMDVQMPEMDGLEATRMLRLCLEIQPVIIAMTANAMHGDRDSCLQAGMDDYISKPIDKDALLAQLEKWSGIIHQK